MVTHLPPQLPVHLPHCLLMGWGEHRNPPEKTNVLRETDNLLTIPIVLLQGCSADSCVVVRQDKGKGQRWPTGRGSPISVC